MDHQLVSIDRALEHFGLGSFRPGQREVIESIVSGNDCLCVMPTGGGKSLCYQLPSLIRPGLTIVVSPLIALMKDQVDSLGRNGIPAALINSTLTHSEQQTRLQDVAAGKYQLVYVAPERLRNPRFLEAIRATPIQLLAIDEAHCISQWGHDFRPDYTRIGQFREWLGGVQTVALTATATPRVRQDIMDVLGLKKPKQFMSGFARPNLHFGVVNCQSDRDKEEQLEKFLRTKPGSGIIYSATRKRCEALVDWIGQTLKIPVGAYHAGLQQEQRRVIQERFMSNELPLIVATNAFGMGIDKPDLRYVLHYNMPGSLEAYYQEAGRAGRDGKDSLAVMLYSMQDRYIQEYFIENNYPPRDVIQQVYEFLQKRTEDPIELTLEEIREQMGTQVSAEAIGSCLQILSRTRVLERFEAGSGLAMVRINSDLHTLVDMFPSEAKVRRQVLRLLERAVGDRRYEDVYIHPRWLLQESGMEREALGRALREINKLEDVEYIPPFRGRAVHFKKQDVPFAELDIDFEALRKRMEAEYDRLNQVVQYAQSPICRQASILQYFGDPNAAPCGQCDRCNRKPGWPGFDVSTVAATPQQRAQQVRQSIGSNVQTASSSSKPASALNESQKVQFLGQILDAIARVHGRLGKILIAQYLCGSSNAKVQKLNLHRLSSFGLLQGFRQDDGVVLLDAMLAAGLLRQDEVNRHRPTVSVSPQLTDLKLRDQLLGSIELTPVITAKIVRIVNSKQASQSSQASQARASEVEVVGGAGVSAARITPTVPASRTTAPVSASTPSTNPSTTPSSIAPRPHVTTAAELASSKPRTSTPTTPTAATTAAASTAQRSSVDRTVDRTPDRASATTSPRPVGGSSLPGSSASPSGAGVSSSSGPATKLPSAQPRTQSLFGDAPEMTSPTQSTRSQSANAQPTDRRSSSSGEAKPASRPHQPDWFWTVELFRKGFDWESVSAIRKLSDLEVASSLCSALSDGAKLDRAWLTTADGERTPGQQRVVREIQRRTNAGV